MPGKKGKISILQWNVIKYINHIPEKLQAQEYMGFYFDFHVSGFVHILKIWA